MLVSMKCRVRRNTLSLALYKTIWNARSTVIETHMCFRVSQTHTVHGLQGCLYSKQVMNAEMKMLLLRGRGAYLWELQKVVQSCKMNVDGLAQKMWKWAQFWLQTSSKPWGCLRNCWSLLAYHSMSYNCCVGETLEIFMRMSFVVLLSCGCDLRLVLMVFNH